MSFIRQFDSVECHEGEPMRVVTSGIPSIPGNTVYEKCKWLEKNDDQLRLLMLREPRGIPATCCNLIVNTNREDCKAGYIIMEQVEYPMMSGGNTIAVATALLETGMIPMTSEHMSFNLEAPAGVIGIEAECDLTRHKCTKVTFKNVPAFPVYLDKEIEVPHLGKVTVDIAWGGMFYCIIDSTQFKQYGPNGLELKPENGKEISKLSALITTAAIEQLPVEHPDYPGVGITLSMMHQPPVTPGTYMRSSNWYATGPVDFDNPTTWTGALDRGVCGTGTCALMATEHAKGRLKAGEPFMNEGLLGIQFEGRIVEEIDDFYGHKAVVPTVGGQCWIYGFNKWVLDESDPFPNGFTIGDIW
ncbi:proline racemase family protein [Blautia schinkii]|nr:proline racemase family protein [Blautia schinkii]